ncbi:MAG TPA: hypothetical protein VK158_04290 [Acidobacteriota bacterium]|nr:hypothetical protein [Acidobacteriota bacterium]
MLRIYIFSFIGILSFYCLKHMEAQFHKAYDIAHRARLETINRTHKDFAKVQALNVYESQRTQALAEAVTRNPHDKSLHGHAWLYRLCATLLVISTVFLCVDVLLLLGARFG